MFVQFSSRNICHFRFSDPELSKIINDVFKKIVFKLFDHEEKEIAQGLK
jgi:hypothetical protein